jgi:Family of unknown function (DUF5989)
MDSTSQAKGHVPRMISSPHMADRATTRVRPRPRRNLSNQVADRVSVSSDLVYLVWRHKLWWMLPLLLAFIVLAALVVLEATPIGPLLYPVF